MTEYICKAYDGKSYYLNDGNFTLIELENPQDIATSIQKGKKLMCIGFANKYKTIHVVSFWAVLRGLRLKNQIVYHDLNNREHLTAPLTEISKFKMG